MEKELGQIKMRELIGDNEVVQTTLSIFDNNFINIINNLDIKMENNGVVCFTGNRPTSMPWRYNEVCELCSEFKSRLKHILSKLIEFGYNKFITGMAMGFDIIAAETIIELKKEYYGLELVCAIPCLNQTKGWKNDYVLRYKDILDRADKVTFTSNYAYFNGCYMIRNKYMVDNSNLVLGCQLKESLGTRTTLSYARKQGKKIITIIN